MLGMLFWIRIALAASAPADGAENAFLDAPLFDLVVAGVEAPATDPNDVDGDGWLVAQDCDDLDPARFPGAPESCDGRDDDCDREIDEELPHSAWFADADGDGYGSDHPTFTCDGPPPGHVGNHADCDDTRTDVHPGGTEVLDNGRDDDCNRFTADDDEAV